MEEDKQRAEDEQRAEEKRKARELAEELTNACIGYSYKCISHAIGLLENRICYESIFTGEGNFQPCEE